MKTFKAPSGATKTVGLFGSFPLRELTTHSMFKPNWVAMEAL